MAERLNAHDSKSCYAGMYTRVQIPFSAPKKRTGIFPVFFLYSMQFRLLFIFGWYIILRHKGEKVWHFFNPKP